MCRTANTRSITAPILHIDRLLYDSPRQTLLGAYKYNVHQANTSDFFITLLSNISELNDFMCGSIKREGDLCYSCVNNTGPSLTSGRVGCYEVSQSGLEWVLPLTPTDSAYYYLLHYIYFAVKFEPELHGL